MKLKITLTRKCMQMFHYHLNSCAARDWFYTTGYTEATEISPVVRKDDITFRSAILAFPSSQPAVVYANQAKMFCNFEVIMRLSLTITFV